MRYEKYLDPTKSRCVSKDSKEYEVFFLHGNLEVWIPPNVRTFVENYERVAEKYGNRF